jgi:hypothetical protein
MGAEHFRELARVREALDSRRGVARLDGEHLALREWTIAGDEASEASLAEFAECFVVPRESAMLLRIDGKETALEPGELAFVSSPDAETRLSGRGCRFLVAGWRRETLVNSGRTAPAVQTFRFADALEPSAPGWRFFSVDGAYVTVGCSYREAPPPAREQPHSHDGEQINVPLEGRFAFTVGDHTETIAPGWAALTPRGVLHTGLHVEFPYFQLIFATPPRGRGYAEFLRSIYTSGE